VDRHPLHLSAGGARLYLDHRGVLRMPPAELALLAAAFQDTFGVSGFTLTPLSSGDFLLSTAGIAAVATTEPARCAGNDVAEALPRGAAAAPLRRLLAEIEMWLHGQALNEARLRRGSRRSRHCGRGVPRGGRCSPSAARGVPCAPSARTRT